MLANNLATGNLRGFRDFSEVAKISCYKVGQVFTRREEKATYGINVRFESSLFVLTLAKFRLKNLYAGKTAKALKSCLSVFSSIFFQPFYGGKKHRITCEIM